MERYEDRQKIHAFVKPKPRPARRTSSAGSLGAGFANFFRNRAPSSMESVRRSVVGRPGNAAPAGGSSGGLAPVAGSGKYSGEVSGREGSVSVGREASASIGPAMLQRDSSIYEGAGRAASSKI